MKWSSDIVVLIVVFVVLIVGGYYLARPGSGPEVTASTTYNPDPNGVRAFYTLLEERLHFTVGRLLKPYTDLPPSTRVLICVQPLRTRAPQDARSWQDFQRREGISDDERDALLGWVKGGGVVIFAADSLRNVPATFGTNRHIGKGAVYVFNSRRIITNKGMRDYTNATALLEIITRHAGKRDLVLFDEYHHGFSDSDSIWSQLGKQARAGVIVLAVALLLLAYSKGRRFGAVRAMPQSETLRPSYEFVESVGRLYQRAHATDLAADILCKSFKQAACLKLGLSGDAPRERITARIESDFGPEPAQRAEAALVLCESYHAGHRPTEQELLDIAGKLRQLEKELGLERLYA